MGDDVSQPLEVLPELRFGAMVGVVADPLGNIESYYNLGSYHRAVDTPSAQAQSWFDRAWSGPTRSITKKRCAASRRHLV